MPRRPAGAEPEPHASDATRKSWFARFAKRAARSAGQPAAFLAAVGCVLLWAATGPLFGFSDTWQLVINTGTTVITFLMVFLIQNTQNRDSQAMQVKLDELIRVTRGAHNALLDLENLDATELDTVRESYEDLANAARAAMKRGQLDTDAPAVIARAERPAKSAERRPTKAAVNGRSPA